LLISIKIILRFIFYAFTYTPPIFLCRHETGRLADKSPSVGFAAGNYAETASGTLGSPGRALASMLSFFEKP
jgi:hypothetical protein